MDTDAKRQELLRVSEESIRKLDNIIVDTHQLVRSPEKASAMAQLYIAKAKLLSVSRKLVETIEDE